MARNSSQISMLMVARIALQNINSALKRAHNELTSVTDETIACGFLRENKAAFSLRSIESDIQSRLSFNENALKELDEHITKLDTEETP